MKMPEVFINGLSTCAFIALLAVSAWRLRKQSRYWTSEDGLHCIGQMMITLSEDKSLWNEVRLLIDPSLQLIACKARKRRALHLNGNWKLIGRPHNSHFDARDVHHAYYAVARKNDPEIVAIIRIPQDSKSTSVLNTLLPA